MLQAKVTNWLIIVAIAAHFTHKFNPKIKIGSKIMFKIIQASIVIIANLGLQSDLITEFNQFAIT